MKLKPILTAIERGASSVSDVVRSESKGAICGRLDIPLYLSRRRTNLSWPRTFPVLLTQDTPDTPENQLVSVALRQLVRGLGAARAAGPSAERSYSRNLLRWSREKLHSEPWLRAIPDTHPDRLRRQTEHRLRKRQTGNESAYGKFLNWFSQWQFDPSHVDADQAENLISLLLAFPPGEFFANRVFEIWCLYQVIESFRRCGAMTVAGPRPLWQRSQPICEMTYAGYAFEIWFQRSLPAAMAGWRYVHNDRTLRGSPDITIIGDGGRRLLIDAKRREVRNESTRSEETYKMLGYLENFRELFGAIPFHAALCFLSSEELFTEVCSARGDKLVLIGAHPDDPGVCAMGGRMDTLIAEWLAHATAR
jgi:hypothetical protein